jgi:hypothetical protein
MTPLLVQAAATWFMTGLIWFVQVVHYPLFDGVGREGFAAYEARHSALTTWVVGPPMLVEAGLALWLVASRPVGVPMAWAWLGLALVGVVWAATGLLSVPQHGVLAAGFDPRAHQLLVATNWVRTLAWTARAVLVALMLARAAR